MHLTHFSSNDRFMNTSHPTAATSKSTSSNTVLRDGLYRGAPAIAVAMVAVLLAGYGRWILPSKLPSTYSTALEEYRSEYDAAQAKQLTPAKLVELGSAIEICYSRLETLGYEIDEWERMQFLKGHIDKLRQLRSSTANEGMSNDTTRGGPNQDDGSQGGPSQDELDELGQQLSKCTEKYDKLVARLASVDSPNAIPVNLSLASKLLEKGYTPDEGESLIGTLQELRARATDNVELALALALLQYEKVWFDAERAGALPPSQAAFAEVSSILQGVPDELPEAQRLKAELMVFMQPESAREHAADLVATILQEQSLNENLSTVLLAHAIQGQWGEVRSLLSQKFAIASPAEQLKLRMETARSAMRLLFSQLSKVDGAWCSSSADGLQITIELYPSCRELNIFIWQAALQQAKVAESLPAELVEAILISSSSQRYLILAVANALKDAPEVAKNYLGFARQQDPQAIQRLASLIWWRFSTSPQVAEQYIDLQADESSSLAGASQSGKDLQESQAQLLGSLLDSALEFEESGLGWLALARTQLIQQKYEAAQASLEESRKTMGDNEVLTAMLKIASEGIQKSKSSN